MINYSSAGEPYKFATLASFPTNVEDGTLAEDLSTHTLYVYNSTSSTWQPVNKTTNYPVNYASIAAGVLPALGAAYAPDGTNVVNNDTVLFTGLTLAADRGVFRATVAAGLVTAWTRVIYGQSPTGASTDGDVVVVTSGTTYGEHWFQCTATTTATWLDLGVGSNYLVRTGTVLSPAVSTDTVEAEVINVRKNSNAAANLWITNTTSGTAASEVLFLSEEATPSTKCLLVRHVNSGFTTAGLYQATRSYVDALDAGGLYVGSRNAAGTVNFFTGGTADANVRMTISAAGFILHQVNQNAGTGTFIKNNIANTAAYETLWLTEDGSVKSLKLSHYNGSFTTAGILQASRSLIDGADTGGLYVGASNAAGTLNFFTGGTADANVRMTISAAGTITAPGIVASTMSTVTVVAAATTFAVASNVVKVTGDAGGNTVATITGGVSGQVVTLIFVDDKVTITDTAAATADTVNLSAAFTSAANTVLTLVYDGNKFFEVSRSVNG